MGQDQAEASPLSWGHLDLSHRVLLAYSTPLANGESTSTESRSVLRDTFLPACHQSAWGWPGKGMSVTTGGQAAPLRRDECQVTLLFLLVATSAGMLHARAHPL